MKKLLCLLCGTLLVITMCSCTKIDNNSSVATSEAESELSKDTATEELQSSKVESAEGFFVKRVVFMANI